MTLELIAAAKLNLALEVTGRRGDGYHDVVSVMQTIDLADRVRLSESPTIELTVSGMQQRGVPIEGPHNLAYAAAQALARALGRNDLGARIELEKNIPAGMGLGGGSSDAAATLRGLSRLWGINVSDEALRDVAASVGSDVPFFLDAGTALVTGRGERVEALPDALLPELTLFLAPLELEDKTRRMYGSLSPSDFSDGQHARKLAESVRRGLPLAETELQNSFDRHTGAVSESLASAMAHCRRSGLRVLTAGSGPGFFSPMPLAGVPSLLLQELHRDWGVRAVACHSLARAEATAIREV